MGLSRHQGKRKGKIRPKKNNKTQAKIPSYIADNTLFKFSKKTCKLAIDFSHNNILKEKIQRLYFRNQFESHQCLIILEHAETRLEETIKQYNREDKKISPKYQKSIEFLSELRHEIADFFELNPIADIYGNWTIEEFEKEIKG
jgi:hypothetical protein